MSKLSTEKPNSKRTSSPNPPKKSRSKRTSPSNPPEKPRSKKTPSSNLPGRSSSSQPPVMSRLGPQPRSSDSKGKGPSPTERSTTKRDPSPGRSRPRASTTKRSTSRRDTSPGRSRPKSHDRRDQSGRRSSRPTETGPEPRGEAPATRRAGQPREATPKSPAPGDSGRTPCQEGTSLALRWEGRLGPVVQNSDSSEVTARATRPASRTGASTPRPRPPTAERDDEGTEDLHDQVVKLLTGPNQGRLPSRYRTLSVLRRLFFGQRLHVEDGSDHPLQPPRNQAHGVADPSVQACVNRAPGPRAAKWIPMHDMSPQQSGWRPLEHSRFPLVVDITFAAALPAHQGALSYQAVLWQLQSGHPRVLRIEGFYRPEDSRVDYLSMVAQTFDEWRYLIRSAPFLLRVDRPELRALPAADFPTSFLYQFDTSDHEPWSNQQALHHYLSTKEALAAREENRFRGRPTKPPAAYSATHGRTIGADPHQHQAEGRFFSALSEPGSSSSSSSSSGSSSSSDCGSTAGTDTEAASITQPYDPTRPLYSSAAATPYDPESPPFSPAPANTEAGPPTDALGTGDYSETDIIMEELDRMDEMDETDEREIPKTPGPPSDPEIVVTHVALTVT